MAVSDKLGMYLPTRDDYISVKRDISDNLAILDAAAGDMDIIINGNTASKNVTSGQFVTVLNSTITGVTDGIYKAVANVAAGVPFVAANLTTTTSGALNELVEHMGSIGSLTDLGYKNGTGDFSLSESIQNFRFIFIRYGYYASGYSNYGTAIIPVSSITVSSDSTYGVRVIGYTNNGLQNALILFKTNTSASILVNSTGDYVRIMGIK